jgi:CheY-like chemotaxis protein
MARVLIVDDEEDVRSLIARVLADGGYQTDVAAEGNEALALYARQRPDLVVLDLMMPGLDGWATLAELRQKPDAPPVLLLTARADYETFTRGVKEGATGFVCKPFRLPELLATCKRVIISSERARTEKPDDRRREPRRPLSVEVKVVSDPDGRTGELVNISRGGVQVDFPEPLTPGERMRVAFHVPRAGAEPLELECRVQWWSGSAARGVAHGLAFVELSESAARQLEDLLGGVRPQ